jgi:zinc transport system substrate-binding protein
MIVMLTRAGAAALSAAALLVSACSSDATGSDGASGGNRMQVTAAFYPLQYVAERIGGDAVEVTSLTPPGGEPHDLELTPQDLATLQESDLVVHLSGFQPAVDEAIAQTPDVVTVDAADSADLEHPDSGHSEDEHGEAGHTEASTAKTSTAAWTRTSGSTPAGCQR